MAEYHAQLDETYREQLEQAMAAVEEILAQEQPKTKIGDPQKLKAAVTELDQVTVPLAEHAMDQAMEAMLRKQGGLPPGPANAGH